MLYISQHYISRFSYSGERRRQVSLKSEPTKMKRNDLRKFFSSSTFAIAFVVSAIYFFDVELSKVAAFFFYSGLLVISMIVLALMMFLVMNQFRKTRKALLDFKGDSQKKI